MHGGTSGGSYLPPREVVDAVLFPLAAVVFDEADPFLLLLDDLLADTLLPDAFEPEPLRLVEALRPAPLPVPPLFDPPRPDDAEPEAAPLLRADGELVGLFVPALFADFVEDFAGDFAGDVVALFAPPLFELFEDDVLFVAPVAAEGFAGDFVALLPLRPLIFPSIFPSVADPLVRVAVFPFAGPFPLAAEDLEAGEGVLDAGDAVPLFLPEARFGFSSTSPTFSPTALAASPTKSATVDAVSEITSVTDS